MVVEQKQHVQPLVADAHLAEGRLPEGVSARRLEANGLGTYGAGLGVHQGVAVAAQHPGDGLDRQAPTVESLELRLKLRGG